MRAALLGITPGGSLVKEQLPEAPQDDTPSRDGFALAVDTSGVAGEGDDGDGGFWLDMPDLVEEGAEDEAAAAMAAGAEAQGGASLPEPAVAAAVPPPEGPGPGVAAPPGTTPWAVPAVPSLQPPLQAVKREEEPRPRGVVVAPPPPKKAAPAAPPLRDWELQRERKRQAMTLRDAGCKAICAIKHGLRQLGAQEDGRAFVPADWDTAFKPLLGSYIKFLLSRPDQFRVLEGDAPGLFTIENVATNQTVVAPAWGSWKKDWKKVKTEPKTEPKAEVKEELQGAMAICAGEHRPTWGRRAWGGDCWGGDRWAGDRWGGDRWRPAGGDRWAGGTSVSSGWGRSGAGGGHWPVGRGGGGEPWAPRDRVSAPLRPAPPVGPPPAALLGATRGPTRPPTPGGDAAATAPTPEVHGVAGGGGEDAPKDELADVEALAFTVEGEGGGEVEGEATDEGTKTFGGHISLDMHSGADLWGLLHDAKRAAAPGDLGSHAKRPRELPTGL